MGGGVAFDEDEVGGFADGDGAGSVCDLVEGGGGEGGGGEGFGWSEAGVDVEFEFADELHARAVGCRQR